MQLICNSYIQSLVCTDVQHCRLFPTSQSITTEAMCVPQTVQNTRRRTNLDDIDVCRIHWM